MYHMSVTSCVCSYVYFVRVSLYTTVTLAVRVHYMYYQPLCQSIPIHHSDSGSTCTLHVLPLHHYLCQSILAYHSNSGSTCTATASLPLCQSIPAYHSNSDSTCTLRVLPLHHYPSVRVSLHTTVTLTVRVHYVYCHCIITPLSEYPSIPQ